MFKRVIITLMCFIPLAGCQSYMPTPSWLHSDQEKTVELSGIYEHGFPGTASWGVLPFINYSDVDSIEQEVARTLAVQLPSKGIEAAKISPEIDGNMESITLSQQLLLSKEWAKEEGISFAFTGDVLKWRYDEYEKPEVELSLSVIDVRTDNVAWILKGSVVGSEGDNIYDVSRRLVIDLLKSLRIDSRQ